MGTTSEWLRVVGFGAYFTFFMLLVNIFTIPKLFALRRFPRMSTMLNFCALALASLSIGMVHEFDWKVLLRGKLGVVFMIATLGTAAIGLVERRARRRAENSSQAR